MQITEFMKIESKSKVCCHSNFTMEGLGCNEIDFEISVLASFLNFVLQSSKMYVV